MYRIDFTHLPELTRMGRVKHKSRWSHKGSVISRNLLVCVISGECRFSIQNETFPMHEGSVLLIPQGIYYIPETSSECEYYFFHFNAKIDETEPQTLHVEPRSPSFQLPNTDYSTVFVEQHISLEQEYKNALLLIARCSNAMLDTDINRKLMADLCFAQLLLLLSTVSMDSAGSEKDTPALFHKILLYIQQNYTKPVTLLDLSEYFGVSKQYVARIFKKHTGLTVTGYINRLKMEHALEMLQYSNLNIGEIADYLGYGSASYFCRLFKRQYLTSPSEYVGKGR